MMLFLGYVMLVMDVWRRTHDASVLVDGSRDGIHRDHMCRLVVPWAVFAPVGGRHFVPGVVEGVFAGEDLHRGVL